MQDTLAKHARHERLQIAIDGPAGAGKSTIGRGLAAALGCAYLDTGLMYRALTSLALERGILPSDQSALGLLARGLSFQVMDSDPDALLVDGRLMRGELRSREVDARVSEVSAHPPVREAMVAQQRAFARAGCTVMVGRDIGTTVLPEAQVKIWVTASPDRRAQRRLAERPGENRTLEEMIELIRQRDVYDGRRAVSPLKAAADAVELDTDALTEAESFARALEIVSSGLERVRSGEARRLHAEAPNSADR